MSSTSEQYDAKKFPLCAPWDGQRGKSYQETFIPNMKSSWGLRGDDFANKQEHLTGNVPGGIPITTPAQRLANNLACWATDNTAALTSAALASSVEEAVWALVVQWSLKP